MREEYIKHLIALYQEDLEDYRELLQRMSSYYSFLNGTDDTDRPNTENEAKDIFQQKLQQFAAYREQVFENLRQRAKQAQDLQAKITSELGTQWEIVALEPHLPAAVYSELRNLVERLREHMAEVLELDAKIIPRLNQELKEIKSELYRLQNSQKTKNAYESSGPVEARFIDKVK